MEMESKRTATLYAVFYVLVGASYVFIGTIAAHPFDDAIYSFNSQTFYYLHGNSFIYLPQGVFFSAINVAGYFPVALLSSFFSTNVLTVQFGVKIPLILFTLLSAYVLYRMAGLLKFDGRYASLLLLTSPIYFFTSVVYGSALVVSMFFLLLGLYLALRGRTVFSAVAYGISVGMYLYPVFAIPVFARYFAVKSGRRNGLKFLLISSVVGAIGQLTVLFYFVKTGHIAFSPNNPLGYLSPTNSVPYYNMFGFLNVIGRGGTVPGQTYNVLYYGSSIAFSLSYFFVRRENVGEETLIAFLLVQGALFAALAPYNLPSYMAALIPLAVIAALLLRRWMYICMMWVSTTFSFLVMQTITHSGFIVYFSDLNTKILNTTVYPHAWYPSAVNSIAGSLYALSLLAFIPVAIFRRKGSLRRLRKSLVSQSTAVGVVVLVGILLFAPVATSVPQNMFLSHTIDSFTADPSPAYINGTSIVATYYFPTLGPMSEGGLEHFLGEIEFPGSYFNVFNLSTGTVQEVGVFSQHLTLPYPMRNATLQLVGGGIGDVSLVLSNSTSSLSPHHSYVEHGNRSTYSFDVRSYLSGEFNITVSSSGPLFLHNSTSLAISLTGIPAYGKVTTGNVTVTNGLLEPAQLGGVVVVTYGGPFYERPRQIPAILVQMVKPMGKPLAEELALGGLLFAGLIVLPPSLTFALMLRGRSEDQRRKR